MDKLIKILEKFDTNRKYSIKKEDWKEKSDEEKYNAVADWFRDCAKDILCGGYFLINGKYIIDLGRIELYYHEEDEKEGDTIIKKGEIKDPIMYHTNDHVPYSNHYKKIGKYPYFKIGSLNLHQSGVDVTFEKPNEYRASFLIRSYRVFEINNNENLEKIEEKLKSVSEPTFNPHSTHIFEDMFPNGVFMGENKDVKIEWKTYDKGGDINQCKRINVAEYKKDNQGEYIKENKKYVKTDPISNEKENYFKYKTNVYYKKESRDWGFIRIGIKEHK